MNNESSISVAVIGLGYFSQFHLNAWQNIDGCRITAVCDSNESTLNTVAADIDAQASKHTVKTYTNAVTLLNEQHADIVDLVVPPPAHANLIRAALKPGRLIICQKPFCVSYDEARRICDEATAADTTVIIHENFRFQPWYRQIKHCVDTGLLGSLYQCRFALRPGDGQGADAYLARQPVFQTMPRLLIHETGVHFIDLFRWLLGPVTSVYADLRRLNPVIRGEDDGLLILQHANGVRSVFDGNRLVDHVASNTRLTMGELTVEGEKGVITLNGEGQIMFRALGAQTTETIAIEWPVSQDVFGGGCVEWLIQHAVNAYRSQQPYENTAEDYLDVVRATEAAYESARQARRIDLVDTQ